IPKVMKYFGDGDEVHMAYNFYLMQQMYMSFARRDPSLVDKAIDKTSKIPESCQWATFLSSHDEITLSTMDSAEREEMLSFLDPESKWTFKTGKSTSMRLATVFNGDDDKTLDALRMLFEVPGSPVIYYGSEIGMENEDLSGKFRDTRMYVRGQFDWAKAEEQRKDPNSMFNKARGMIRKRRGI
ncbi:MAG: alpha-amylase family glycosyl hydrolase, partial [Candidatus Paceibacterota bacterium]